MLLSPGHSPRHISPSPSAASNTERDQRSASLLPPPASLALPAPPSSSVDRKRRRRHDEVLDEDTYVAAIEKIIERDFFPDIPKMRDRLDWLEAVRSGDPVLIRDAQLKILDRRRARASQNQHQLDPDRSIRTPASSFFRSSSASATPFVAEPSSTYRNHPSTSEEVSAAGAEAEDQSAIDDSLSLDEFFRRYTSEDNESFNRIMDKVNRKRRERYAHLLLEDNDDGKGGEETRGRITTDGYGTSGQPTSTLDGWKYTAKNLLMYEISGLPEAPLTDAEKADRIKSLSREIDRPNTRFRVKSSLSSDVPDEGVTNPNAPAPILYSPVAGTTPGMAWPFPDREAERTKKYDLDELKKTPKERNPFYVESSKKSEEGYSFIRTPSPAPGVDESPFITWGEIDGTPLRLDPCEGDDDDMVTLSGSMNGPRFSIPCPPSRDVKAHSLSRDAARKIRERSMMFRKPPLHSPVRRGSASPNIRTLSPAAQKFVRSAMAKSASTVDETLRASYRGMSPFIGTPKEPRSSPSTRFAREKSTGSASPSARQRSNPPW
ncbi:hypothetical protein QJS10_CPB22g00011 [Acorus calamus]|uniref:Protein DGCR14 n=1 Tax=Acorus calamus TaxID=4465 RepID=A0AAV9C285_ACOCL|nr:hypothetical protein QJS10_CPB22g00011 [Acorus calamus]